MSYVDIAICIGSLLILETWPPIYRGQERTVRDRLRVSQSSPYVYFQYTPCLTDFTFEFIRRPTPPILSPSYWTFIELTLITTLQVHIHLGVSRMNGIGWIMCFLHNQFSEFRILWYANTLLKPYNPLLIFVKSLRLSFTHMTLYFLYLLI
jgi:hypothetical protein